MRASATIAKYGIEQSDSESSPSPLYTTHNIPSSSKRNSEDQEKFPMDSEPEDRILRLESGLSEAKEQLVIGMGMGKPAGFTRV